MYVYRRQKVGRRKKKSAKKNTNISNNLVHTQRMRSSSCGVRDSNCSDTTAERHFYKNSLRSEGYLLLECEQTSADRQRHLSCNRCTALANDC